jgi:hypothetical protein
MDLGTTDGVNAAEELAAGLPVDSPAWRRLVPLLRRGPKAANARKSAALRAKRLEKDTVPGEFP